MPIREEATEEKDDKHEAISPAGIAYYTVVNFYFAPSISFMYFSKLKMLQSLDYL